MPYYFYVLIWFLLFVSWLIIFKSWLTNINDLFDSIILSLWPLQNMYFVCNLWWILLIFCCSVISPCFLNLPAIPSYLFFKCLWLRCAIPSAENKAFWNVCFLTVAAVVDTPRIFYIFDLVRVVIKILLTSIRLRYDATQVNCFCNECSLFYLNQMPLRKGNFLIDNNNEDFWPIGWVRTSEVEIIPS